jgi:putative DNA primase/helicase
MTPEIIARALGGHRVGSAWMARCPAHDDRAPSLSLTETQEGKVLVRCHAGCGQARVITELRARGLWDAKGEVLRLSPRKEQRTCRADGTLIVEDDKRTEAALNIWAAAKPVAETLAEAYLRSRGLEIAPPPALRFHPRLRHPSGSAWPALVTLVTHVAAGVTVAASERPIGISRLFLARDGQAKAPVTPQRMMLGACRGGAAQLAEAATRLMVGEGVETCLAAMQATGVPAWAALSTSGLRALELPADVREVIVLADGDPPGEAAARDAAERWTKQGRAVRIARPPAGLDFNDVLRGARP